MAVKATVNRLLRDIPISPKDDDRDKKEDSDQPVYGLSADHEDWYGLCIRYVLL